MNDGEIRAKLKDMGEKLDAVREDVARHEVMLEGDRLSKPPVPGLFKVTDGLVEEVSDPERGLSAVHQRVKVIEDDKKFGRGAAWAIGLGASAIGSLAVLFAKWVSGH